jgi:hypothetical protein
MKKEPLIVYLTGGLGNQLFQLAHAISLDPEREVLLEWTLGKPRCNFRGLPDIQSFRLPERVQFLPATRYSRLASKTAGYLLRSGIEPTRWEAKPFIRQLALLLGAVVLSSHFRRIIRISCGTGIGYSQITTGKGTSFIIGYFQSFKFAKDVHAYHELKHLSPIEKNFESNRFKELAKAEEPIVVHFRFADYKFEDSFGIPGTLYYRKSLEALTSKYPSSKIWVFTDEAEAAEKVFPSEFASNARWFTDKHMASAETLEIMRLGKSYIIANSTFSWWGAMLSKTENPVVICPDVWFKSQSEPLDLIPANWKRLPAW